MSEQPVQVRQATVADAAPIAHVQVAEEDGAVAGFIGAGRGRRDDVAAEVEVYVIHVLPEHRGNGVGGKLWTAACERIAEHRAPGH
jgi:ribosomal protein S18 acetylase RimI-like enzyme